MELEQKLKHALKSNNITTIHETFEEIYNEYNRLVYFIIIKYVRNSEDVKDLVQDTFISFYNNINHNINNIKYYLITSAKNKSLNYLKSNKEILLNDDFIYQVEENQQNNNIEYLDIIDKMTKILSEFEMEIVLQHNIYGLTFKEISIKYGKKIGTILSLYNRAIKKFKKGIK